MDSVKKLDVMTLEKFEETLRKLEEQSMCPPRYYYFFCQGIPLTDDVIIDYFKDCGGVIVVGKNGDKWLCGERYKGEK